MAELTVDQRRAIALARAKAAAKAKSQPGAMAQVNRGIVDGVGGLVDLVNPFDKPHALNPFPEGTGSARDGLTGLMERSGIDVAEGEAQNVGQAILRGTGEAASLAFPAGMAARGLSAAGGVTGRIAGDASRALATRSGAAGEVAAGGIASGASQAAEEAGLPEWAQNTAAVAAPMGALAAGNLAGRASQRIPVVNALRQANRAVTAAAAPYTRAGAQEVASRRLRDLAGGIDRADELAGRIGGENALNLTPAQQTGDQNMLAVEQLAASQNPNIRERLESRAQASRDTAERELSQPGDIQDTREFFETRRREFSQNLRERAQTAIQIADNIVQGIGPTRSEAENSLQVSNRLNTALDEAKLRERDLWEKVPMDALAPTTQSQQALSSWRQRFGQVGEDNIPPAARRWLSDEGLGDEASVRDMHQLYSSLRETARGARAGNNPQPRMAAAADSIADAILDDLGASANLGEVGRTINEARAFSRAMHETFDRGAVGRLMKRTIDGDTSIDPELALQRTVGRGGVEGAVGSRQIEAGDQFPRPLSPSRPEGEQSPFVQDYLKQRFQDAITTPTGDFSMASASKFMRDNRDLLDRYPQLRDDVRDALQARDSAGQFSDRIGKRLSQLQDSRMSAGAALLNGSPSSALRAFTEARNPVQAARSIVNEARKDETGAALSGVKSLLSDELIRRAGGTGEGIAEALDTPKLKAALRQVFTPAEISRMRVIGRELFKLDIAGQQAPSIGNSLSGASTNEFIETIARIKAAQIGGAAGGSNMGGSLQTANILSSRVRDVLGRLTADRASMLLADAVEDPKLFRQLLTTDPSSKMTREKVNLLLPYLLGTASGATGE